MALGSLSERLKKLKAEAEAELSKAREYTLVDILRRWIDEKGGHSKVKVSTDKGEEEKEFPFYIDYASKGHKIKVYERQGKLEMQDVELNTFYGEEIK